MSELPKDLKYSEFHQWAKLEEDGLVSVGITEFAQNQLGDLVYIQLPVPGQQVEIGTPCAVVESVKTASDVHSPVSGVVIAVNEELSDEPEQVNDTPYQAWMFRIKPDHLTELDQLMDAAAYSAHLA